MTDTSDEMLMAFADGELDTATAAAVAKAVAASPELARRVEAFRETRRVAKSALGSVGARVPDPLAAKILRGNVGGQRTMARFAPSQWALAASIALVAGIGGILIGNVLQPAAPTPQLLAADAAVTEALNNALTGQAVMRNGAEARATGTYQTAAGICRTFSVQRLEGGAVGVGCRENGTWRIALAAATGGGAFTPAASSAAESVDALLDTLGAGGPLSAEDEQRLRATAWQPQP